MNQLLPIIADEPIVPLGEWRDPLTGCIRRDIQAEWKAECHGQSRVFYTDPNTDAEGARAWALRIWTTARNWPDSLTVTKQRGPLVRYEGYLPEDHMATPRVTAGMS